MFTEDPTVFYATFGETLVLGTSTGTCLAEFSPADNLAAYGKRSAVRVFASEWPTIAAGDSVTFRSVAYTVKTTPEKIAPDEAWLMVDLQRA
jgi:hypothetical protein